MDANRKTEIQIGGPPKKRHTHIFSLVSETNSGRTTRIESLMKKQTSHTEKKQRDGFEQVCQSPQNSREITTTTIQVSDRWKSHVSSPNGSQAESHGLWSLSLAQRDRLEALRHVQPDAKSHQILWCPLNGRKSRLDSDSWLHVREQFWVAQVGGSVQVECPGPLRPKFHPGFTC